MASPAAVGSTRSISAIRAAFPALERRQDGLPVAYFDGPGGTQVPRSVAAAMEDYLFRHNANTHWFYPSSEETDEAIDGAREAFADFVNGSREEIAFGANMTTLTFHLSRALGRAWGPGDEIVVTELDHHANIDPWRALARERGVTVRMVRMRTETGRSTRRISSGPSGRARASSRSAPRRTRSGRSTTSRAPRRSPGRSARSSSSMPCMRRLTF
jgi:selenocysteine lyase/cysteine desulfurase